LIVSALLPCAATRFWTALLAAFQRADVRAAAAFAGRDSLATAMMAMALKLKSNGFCGERYGNAHVTGSSEAEPRFANSGNYLAPRYREMTDVSCQSSRNIAYYENLGWEIK
jgi:hypothetical protein